MQQDEEFRTLAGLILAQLEDAFPIETKIDEKAIASNLGVEIIEQDIGPMYRQVYDAYAGSRYSYGQLDSGRPFLSVLWSTLKWLRDEGYD